MGAAAAQELQERYATRNNKIADALKATGKACATASSLKDILIIRHDCGHTVPISVNTSIESAVERDLKRSEDQLRRSTGALVAAIQNSKELRPLCKSPQQCSASVF